MAMKSSEINEWIDNLINDRLQKYLHDEDEYMEEQRISLYLKEQYKEQYKDYLFLPDRDYVEQIIESEKKRIRSWKLTNRYSYIDTFDEIMQIIDEDRLYNHYKRNEVITVPRGIYDQLSEKDRSDCASTIIAVDMENYLEYEDEKKMWGKMWGNEVF